MILHVTRHGQTDVRSDHPPGDPRLTALGREQARLLGQKLRENGFAGRIYSSPYLRTTETAHLVAEETSAVVEPASEMREYVIREHQMDGIRGATQSELAAAYATVRKTFGFTYPWWTTDIESDEDIEARVTPLIDRVTSADEDALLVGHGASVGGVHRRVMRCWAPDRIDHGQRSWNCFLSSFRIKPAFEILRIMDVGHLPENAVTSNALTRAEVLADQQNRS